MRHMLYEVVLESCQTISSGTTWQSLCTWRVTRAYIQADMVDNVGYRWW